MNLKRYSDTAVTLLKNINMIKASKELIKKNDHNI